MITQDLLSAILGKPENNPELQKFFTQLGQVEQLSEYSSSYYLNYPSKGLSFSFNGFGYLVAIHVYAHPIEDFQSYSGILPKELPIHGIRAKIEEKIGVPTKTDIKNHGAYPQLGIYVSYLPHEVHEQESKIKHISFQTPRENTLFRKPEYYLQLQNLTVNPDKITDLLSLSPSQIALKGETFRNSTRTHQGNLWEFRLTPEATYQQAMLKAPQNIMMEWAKLHNINYLLTQLLPYQEEFSYLTQEANVRILIRDIYLKKETGFRLSSRHIKSLVSLGISIDFGKR